MSIFIYLFKKLVIDSAVLETSGRSFDDQQTSIETVVDFYSYCREMCLESLYNSGGFKKVGGQNYTVEIDEAKFEKRKYNRGRLVDGQWVLGGIIM